MIMRLLLVVFAAIITHGASGDVSTGRTPSTERRGALSYLTALRGGATGGQTPSSPSNRKAKPIRVAFQGEAGAYSEKSLRELLGPNVIAVPRTNFEACYRAVASKECDYACIPIENSLGGSIHENYDLMLRYDLTIVAEHDFRVRHCLLTKPGLVENVVGSSPLSDVPLLIANLNDNIFS